MTPKEKALELYYKYYQKCADSSYPENMAKECALIAVDEVICEIVYFDNTDGYAQSRMDYWEEVKSEIDKL
jgi:hypothetical protein